MNGVANYRWWKGDDYMPYKNIADLLILNVHRYPEKTAVIYKDIRLSYKDLNRRINKTAHALQGLGVGVGDKVGYLLHNSNQLIEVYFAIQKIGAIAVPLNYCLITREIRFLVDSSQCKALIYSEESKHKLDPIKDDFFSVSILISASSLEEMLETYDTEEPSLFQDEHALSRIQYTGGTTGISKGVMRSHHNDISEIMSVMMSSRMGATSDEIVLIQCPMEHHGGHSWFVSVMGSGGTLVICDSFKPEEILTLIEKEHVTYLLLLPPSTHFRLLNFPNFSKYDVSSVRFVQSAAGSTTAEITRKIYEAYPNCIMNYGWGQTESGTGSSLVLTLEMAEKELPEIKSVGKPMPFIEMKIIDEHNNEVPVGEVGECVVRGPSVMLGYYNQPKLTAEVFLEDGWIRTGDMMRKDEEGYFYLMSRKKDMIKSGGENVFAQEVADVIRKHDKVEECIVFGVPNKKLGEAVMTVVQLRSGCTLTLEELQAHCKSYLSSYKKPLYLAFIDKFPMNDAGKIPKYMLVKEYREKILNEERL